MARLPGKAALVTGAGTGIGRAVALRFAEEGARIIIADLNIESAEETVQTITDLAQDLGVGAEARALRADVSVAEDCRRMVEETVAAFGRLDILVNNAGIEIVGTTVDVTEEQWDRIMAVNVKSIFLTTKFAVPQMLAQGSGVIINIASIAGIRGSAGLDAYVASKHAVVGLTRSLALDYAAQGIRVNAVCPGMTRTSMAERLGQARGRGDSQGSGSAPNRQGSGWGAMRRYAEPYEVANVCLHLASDEASFTTGHLYVIDGGRTVS